MFLDKQIYNLPRSNGAEPTRKVYKYTIIFLITITKVNTNHSKTAHFDLCRRFHIFTRQIKLFCDLKKQNKKPVTPKSNFTNLSKKPHRIQLMRRVHFSLVCSVVHRLLSLVPMTFEIERN